MREKTIFKISNIIKRINDAMDVNCYSTFYPTVYVIHHG